MSQVVLAYEPVWAIGTGLVCPADVAQEVHQFCRSVISKKYGQAIADKVSISQIFVSIYIKSWIHRRLFLHLQVIIQYGGSVKPDNVKEIMAQPDIDGCLVGGASLTADSFAKIVHFNDQ